MYNPNLDFLNFLSRAWTRADLSSGRQVAQQGVHFCTLPGILFLNFVSRARQYRQTLCTYMSEFFLPHLYVI